MNFTKGARLEGTSYVSSEPEIDFSEIEDEKSLCHRYLKLLRGCHANTVLWIDQESGRKWTGLDAHDKILAIACALIDLLEFEKGSVVCINYHNSDTALILALGIICAGGIVANGHPKDPYPELLHLNQKIQPDLMFCGWEHEHWVERLSQDTGRQIKSILMDKSIKFNDDKVSPSNNKHPNNGQHFMSVEELFEYDFKKSKTFAKLPVPCKDVKKDIAIIRMSSGSTGKPKTISLSHWSVMSNFGKHFKAPTQIHIACTSSLHYISGVLVLLGAIENGYTTIILKEFNPKTYCQAIEDYKISSILLTVGHLYKLMTFQHLNKYNLSSVMVLFPTGAKITIINELREFVSRYPNIKIIQTGFGTSEIGGVSMVNMTVNEYFNSVSTNCGNLMPSRKAKIIDLKSKIPLIEPNQMGLLFVKSHMQFIGYYDAGARRFQGDSPLVGLENFDLEGFHNTGDLAYFDEHGQLHVFGRYVETMLCRAIHTLPGEIEEVIRLHPLVADACVFGVMGNREARESYPRAFVVIREFVRHWPDDILRKKIKSIEETTSPGNCEKENGDDWENLRFDGISKMSSLNKSKRQLLQKTIMKFVNTRVAWAKQLTGGVVIMDSLPIIERVGKVDKNKLKCLSANEIEIYGDYSY